MPGHVAAPVGEAGSRIAGRSIYEVLDDLRRVATDERGKGDLFEHLMVAYLQTDPTYARRFAHVWRWTDWPDRPAHPDTGIDLIAEERETGGLCAIQCKFYDPDHYLQKEDLDSFFTESGKSPFATRLVISTTDRWSKHAEAALEGQQIPVTRLRVQDLDDSPVDWDLFDVARPKELVRRAPKELRPHQHVALDAVVAGLADHDRGKLIMACGTGKTFTTLRLAERMAGGGGKVLFLVPSISLLSQSLKEWSSEAKVPLRVFAVCSDVRAGKRTASEDIGPYDLAYPATTDAKRLATIINAPHSADAMTVVFSTYQSIDKVSAAQTAGVGAFDLVICDEAHRTTGVTLSDEDESAFVRVHDNGFLPAVKRLYMTGTPRIYDDSSKARAAERDAMVCSMDDETHFGPELHRLGFGEAVEKNLLSDYRVLVLAVDEEYVSRAFQRQLSDTNHELNLDDAARIVGCLNGLSKRGVSEQTFAVDPKPMQRAVAFCNSIKNSKRIVSFFNELSPIYTDIGGEGTIRAEAEHVDGTFNALLRSEKLDWLRGKVEGGSCRVLSNARCLSEGVDVPALDAVMFLNPRKSIVDVVQGVGRVMRTSPGKQYGYVILPIGVPTGVAPEVALADNERYRVVWQVLQALRAHDDRFNAMVNKIDLNRTRDDKLQVIGVGGGPADDDDDLSDRPQARNIQNVFSFGDIEAWQGAIYAKIVEKVGDRRYWEDWAKDVAAIAQRQTARIKTLLRDPDMRVRFDEFVEALRRNINDSVTEDDAIEMLSQHLITKPVFEALFSDYEFVRSNPVSLAMQQMVDALGEQGLEKEVTDLEGFYASVRKRAKGIDNAEGKQKIVLELYQRFFKTALPKVTDRLGIVYTPIQIVDFMVKSVEDILRAEFGVGLADRGVHVLDPFTGTGTFLVRLIQSGLINSSELTYKYSKELHANEIVLLAYYIAAINIEAAYHGLAGGDYLPFEGVVLTDTFQLYESGRTLDEVFFPQNNARVQRQRQADIRVILGNPPYSIGQGSANDVNQNLKYSLLDGRIRDTYVAASGPGRKRGIYDSYYRAFRWASDRISDRGIVCFVTNSAFIDKVSADGFRNSVAAEFTSLYCLDLKGAVRGKKGDEAKREGGNVFDILTGVAITLLVKNPDSAGHGTIHYRSIGDSINKDEKLRLLSEYKSVLGVTWQDIVPTASGDWINVRSDDFDAFYPLGVKGVPTATPVFEMYSQGVNTARDSWAYNFSQDSVLLAMSRMIEFYNIQRQEYQGWRQSHRGEGSGRNVDEFLGDPVRRDPVRISWSENLIRSLEGNRALDVDPDALVVGMYRPYCKQWLYYHQRLNWSRYQVPRLFPTPRHRNLVIATTGTGARRDFSALMVDAIPDYQLMDNGRDFPLYVYSPVSEGQSLLEVDEVLDGYTQRVAITDPTLTRFQDRYGNSATKDEIFYYVYGLLHAPAYRKEFADDLRKQGPRIPLADDFAAFSSAGRELAEWHLGYETAALYPLDGLPESGAEVNRLSIVEMRFGKKNGKPDRSMIIVNSHVALSGIPEEAYEYQVNGRSPVEWVMDRYKMTTHKTSRIHNDPNTWAEDPRYVVDLVARLVRVSLETVRIVDALPTLAW